MYLGEPSREMGARGGAFRCGPRIIPHCVRPRAGGMVGLRRERGNGEAGAIRGNQVLNRVGTRGVIGPRRTELEGHRCSPWRLQRRVILGRVGGVSPLLFPVGRCRPMARGIELRAVPRPHPGLIGLVSACSCEGSPFHRIRRRRPGRFPGRPGIYPHHSHGPAAVSFLFQSSGSLPVASSTRISGWRGDFPRCGCPMAALSLPARPWLTSGYLSLASRSPGSGAG